MRLRYLVLGLTMGASLLGFAQPGPARAVDYCVYHIVSGFAGLTPELNAGDIICVDCPTTLKCPGPSGTVFTATIKDAGGTEAEGRLRKADDACIACPSTGKTGYVFTKVPQVSLGEDDIDWVTIGNVVRFHLRFRNVDPNAASGPVDFRVMSQTHYGAYVPDMNTIYQGSVGPMAIDSFFDVFFEIPLDQLPPPPPKTTGSGASGGFSAMGVCDPGVTWSGNIDVVWFGPGGGGMVNKHLGALDVLPGVGVSYIHLITGCAGMASWSVGPLCSGWSVTLVNEDFTPAPAPLPAGWTGWICVSAAASVPVGTTCCFAINLTCTFVPATIDLCATACSGPTPTERSSWGRIKAIYR